ncbi:MBL fold metallo-hydrolase [Mitsuaria sp. GD03876]|uniref:MBL fold metallo-hydrolase n=1 Tax=Mitsuaria sp. GD03876 TaxID=2975399 RepID=UPI00244B3D3F|nr:MBL fold metallo-hydrolase [Mitsuaria sp. GD03876]MDH0866349.1 MBL fold metallo-hydrolase [Mitsuaria sp. GD03876]
MRDSTLPAGVQVFERGWLSSNNILLHGSSPAEGAVLVDSGYASHVEQTLALVANALHPGETIRLLANTHLHSDHCGGNAALSEAYGCPIAIPPGEFDAIARWDEAVLSYRATGQQCPRFVPASRLIPGDVLRQAGLNWEIHAAPGHDPHSVMLFERNSRTLISADALWERGFGIVFPELDGDQAFDEVEATLNLIEALQPALVIPGHGSPFLDVETALVTARGRLDYFRREPVRHATSAAKALTVFHMLEVRRCSRRTLEAWLMATPILISTWERFVEATSLEAWADQLINELLKSGSLREIGESHDGDSEIASVVR